MKEILIIAIALISQTIIAQKHFTRTGTTNFKASVETFEAIEATNKSATAILITDTGDFAVQLFISAFEFKVALMQEHFNENYMDSNQFPKATFRGQLEGFSLKDLSKEKELPLKGTLTVRGEKKKVNTIAKLISINGKIKINASFSVQPKDFGIKIPSIVRKKIAEHINVTINYELAEKK